MANLPNKSFLINYNARDYNATTHSIPAHPDQTVQSACTFERRSGSTAAPTVYEDYIHINTGWSAYYLFGSAPANPFNRDSSNKALTIIYRWGNIAGINQGSTATPPYITIISNRASNFNWGARQGILHTANASFLTMWEPSTDHIGVVRVDSSGKSERFVYGDEANYYISASSITYGAGSPGVAIFQGEAVTSMNEWTSGDFYWLYVSTEALTDAEIAQVVAYNDNTFGVVPDSIDADYTGTSETVQVTSEGPWTASTNDSWISVSPLSGNSGGSVTITIAANNGNARTGTVTFTDSGSNVATLSVSQEHYPLLLYSCRFNRSGNLINKMYRSGELIYHNVVLSPTLEISNYSITFQKSGGTMDIGVTSNTSWNATTSDSWLTISTANTGFTVNADNYTGDSARTGTITVTARNAYSSITKTIQVEQVVGYEYSYLTIVSLADNNTISLNLPTSVTSAYVQTVSYSTDNGSTWNTTTVNNTDQTISVNLNNGDKVLWKGTATRYSPNGSVKSHFYGTANYEIEGNIMSLLYDDNFRGQTTLTASYTFFRLFDSNPYLTSIDNLIMPATTLSTYCYQSMFQTCTGLVTIENFKLPATTLVERCYNAIFADCTNLVTACELPAPTLAKDCYRALFIRCTKLKNVRCLATSGINQNTSTYQWLNQIASSGTFYKSPNANVSTTSSGSGNTWPRSVDGIPSGWTVVDAS